MLPNGGPAIIMVHGGCHGAWSWERYGPLLSAYGWESHAIDWFNHGDSDPLPEPEFTKRSIADVTREISLVAEHINRPFVLMGHSMGGLVAQCAAQTLAPEALALLTPVVPAEVGATPIEIPLDRTKPFPVPPIDIAKGMFFSTMPEAEVKANYQRLQPESSQAVFEATRWTVSVDLAKLTMPTMTLAAAKDTLTPPAAVAGLAGLIKSEHIEVPNLGHSEVLLHNGAWHSVATRVESWLRSTVL